MQYTNKLNYMDPQDCNNLSDTYCRYSNNYPFINDQNKNIYFSFNDFLFFKPYYLSNLINKMIILIIHFISLRIIQPMGVAVYRDNKNRFIQMLQYHSGWPLKHYLLVRYYIFFII